MIGRKMDRVVELEDVPQSDTGVPAPRIYATEQTLYLVYIVEHASEGEYALVKFASPVAHTFGPPNDEALHGHRLYRRGLTHYSANEVFDSSWIRALVEMNSVHPRHDSRVSESWRHFVLAFHDSTFECIAKGYEVEKHKGVNSLPSFFVP
ncbi:MAG: hypothetical protein JST12_08590 [Armatimonadetes bacterium]|nr:hypothetical protein [Armatimonadota bacterium]